MEIAVVVTFRSPKVASGLLNEGTDDAAITRPGKKLENSVITIGETEHLQELGMVIEGDGDANASRLYQEG